MKMAIDPAGGDKLKSSWRNTIVMSQGPLWDWREITRRTILHLEKCRV